MEPTVDGADTDRPSVARMYDYFLGGSHNLAVDRTAAEAVLRVYPSIVADARANRSFLRRAVRHLVQQGVDQFLDLGSGIPTVGNVHEVAQGLDPAARVAYVDVEPVAAAYARQLLAGNPRAVAVHADLRRPDDVLGDPEVRRLLDLDRPVAVLMVSVLHFVPDTDDPRSIVDTYLRATAPGSHLVVSHVSTDHLSQTVTAGVRRARDLYDATTNPVTMRSREWIVDLFSGLDLVEPGVVLLSRWRPDLPDEPHPQRVPVLGGVGRKP